MYLKMFVYEITIAKPFLKTLLLGFKCQVVRIKRITMPVEWKYLFKLLQLKKKFHKWKKQS